MFDITQAQIDKAKLGTICAVGGAVAVMIAGSFWPGWSTEKTVQKRLAERDKATLVRVLAPVCAEKFRAQPNLAVKVAELKGVSSWQRDGYLVKGNYVVKSGLASTDSDIGTACANMLDDLTK